MSGFTYDYLCYPYEFVFKKDRFIIFADNEKEFLDRLASFDLLDDYYSSIGYVFGENLFDCSQ